MYPQLDKLIILLKAWIAHKKVGSITVNFFKGVIGVIELKESVKLDKE